ncbi:MAG: MarR family transcriptional regulator [Burkholderiaceae bacterium]
MDLQAFMPYRLAVVAEAVSRSLAAVYAQRFNLTRDEWRILAALAVRDDIKGTELGSLATLDKMQVSRALTRMERNGLIERQPDAADRRNLVVRLKPAGRALYRKIVPMARSREAYLLESLDADERSALDSALDKLLARARQLQEHG